METPPLNRNMTDVLNYVESQNVNKNSSSCGCLKYFHDFLSRSFYKLGYTIGSKPSYFIIIPFFLSLLGTTGVQQMKYESDPEYLFSPQNSRGRLERNIVENYFPIDYSRTFSPDRQVKLTNFIRVLVKAKDGGTMFRNEVWDELIILDEMIQNVTITWEGNVYKFKDVCALTEGKCFERNAMKINDVIPEVVNGTAFLNYPLMLFPLILPHIYGGGEINETEGIITAAKAISMSYWLKGGNADEIQRSFLFEKGAVDVVTGTNFSYLEASIFASRSLEDELERNNNTIIPYVFVNVILMIMFSVFCVSRLDWAKSKFFLGFVAIISSVMATAAAFGFLMYMGVPHIGINNAAPFLMLGIGLDDMFVVLSAWHRTKPQFDVPVRLAEAYSDAAVAITITSLTNMFSFYVGTLTPFPSVQIFCIYTGTCVLATYLWFLFFFGGFLALAGRLEKNQKHAVLICKTVLSKSEAEKTKGCWYKFWCAGGINQQDPWNPIDNKQHSMMTFFRDYLGKALTIPAIKAFVICVFAIYMAGAVYGCLNVKEGLQLYKLALDDSYLVRYFHDESDYFRKFPYRVQVIIHGDINYSDPEIEKGIIDLHDEFESTAYVGTKMFSRSFLRSYYGYLRRRPRIRKNMTNNEDFIRVLKEKYLPDPSRDYYNDISRNEDDTDVLATRFVIQTTDLKDSNDDTAMMSKLRRIADNAPFKVDVFSPYFVFFDQFILVRSTSIQTISYAAIVMIIISLIFIPSPLCSLWIGFSIISIEIGVIGYMSLWDINLDSVSMINLIMCIGFSVDFSAHISYAYLTSKASDSNEKIRECLYSLGLPILQGGCSTILGVSILSIAPSYVFQAFFKIVFLVISFGILHGIFLLPVLLSLLGPGSCSKSRSKGENMHHAGSILPHLGKLGPIPNLETFDKRESDDSEQDLGIGSSGSSQSSLQEEEIADKAAKPTSCFEGITNESYENSEIETERL